MSCGVGHRCGSDPSLLWLWCRPVAAAPIQPLAWELPYTAGAALKRKEKKKKKKRINQIQREVLLCPWFLGGELLESLEYSS